MFLILIIGQLLSLLLCGTGTTAQLLQVKYDVSIPTSLAFINYVLLALTFGVYLASRRDFVDIVSVNWWKYIALGVIDVEANFLVILAYHYTSLTSIQLLDSFTIISVMVLSFIFLKTRYRVINIMGVCCSFVGILCLVMADATLSGSQSGSHNILGDAICLAGTVLYAVSNVSQEFLVKNHSISEFLGMLGISGSVVSGIQLVILERRNLAAIDWNAGIGLSAGGFGVFLFIFSSTLPLLMKFSNAVIVNLSLLSSDIYTFVIGIIVFHYKFSVLYILSLCLIVCGVFIFNMKEPRNKHDKECEQSNLTVPQQATQSKRMD